MAVFENKLVCGIIRYPIYLKFNWQQLSSDVVNICFHFWALNASINTTAKSTANIVNSIVNILFGYYNTTYSCLYISLQYFLLHSTRFFFLSFYDCMWNTCLLHIYIVRYVLIHVTFVYISIFWRNIHVHACLFPSWPVSLLFSIDWVGSRAI